MDFKEFCNGNGKLILFCEESIDGRFTVGIDSDSDFDISIDMSGHDGHGDTRGEAINDFKKNISKLAGEVNRVQCRLTSCIYDIKDYGV